MKTSLLQRVVCLLMIYVLLVPQTWATCGGGGGGGMGGMGGGSSQQTYQVPWKLITPQEPVKEGLAVYWFPTGKQEVEKSSLRESRTLQLYSQQCVTMGIVDVQSALGQKYVPDGKLPVAVLVQADGTVVNKLENTKRQAQGWRPGKAGGKRDEEARVGGEREDGSRQSQGQVRR